MIHRFPAGGAYAALDVNSGTLHLTDKIVYDILEHYGGKGALGVGDLSCLPSRLAAVLPYSAGDIAEAFAEIRELEEDGLLFSCDPLNGGADALRGVPVIKALCLLVAQDCNLRCEYCFAGDGEYGGKGLMSVQTGRQAVDFLIESSGNRHNLEIDFFGGEPLLNLSAVMDITAYARSLEKAHNKKFRFTITTNGLLLDDSSIEWINDNMSNVVLSLDGREHVNDSLRKRVGGQGSYAAVLPGIQRLAAARKSHPKNKGFYVRGTFTRRNLDFAEDAAHLSDLGFTDISVEPVVAPADAPYSIRDCDLPRIFDEYDKLADLIRGRKSTPTAFNFFHFTIDLEGGPCIRKRVSGCGAGAEYAAVTFDGKLYPCHQFAGLPDKDDFLMGDVFTGLKPNRAALALKDINIYTKDGCTNCFAKFYCGGGCAANSHSLAKDVNKNYEIGCAMTRKRLECALALAAENH